jgi:hypothetical protein
LVKALDWGSREREFESPRPDKETSRSVTVRLALSVINTLRASDLLSDTDLSMDDSSASC